jgi:hypothetical protein
MFPDELSMSDTNAYMAEYGNFDFTSVGPNSNGTYTVPAAAQPNNTPWDTAGGTLGNYSNEVFGILRDGIGAWSQYKKNDQFLDYQRYEANQGGVYRQGYPAGTATATVSAGAAGNPLLMIMLIGAAILLLRK